jgi:hypothetical protein
MCRSLRPPGLFTVPEMARPVGAALHEILLVILLSRVKLTGWNDLSHHFMSVIAGCISLLDLRLGSLLLLG